jgi:hypothetical protein
MPPIPPLPPGQYSFRDLLYEISPRWLRAFWAWRLLYSIAVHVDGFIDAAVAAIKYRFPGYYTYQSLAQLARDRKMRRGRIEPDAAFALRLRGWIEAHKRRGTPPEMLRQLSAYHSNAYEIELVNHHGLRWLLGTDGSITHDMITWEPTKTPEQWAQWWLFYHWPVPVPGDGIWSDPGVWDDGGVWDSGLTAAQVEDLSIIPQEWNAGHIRKGSIILLNGDVELWDYPPGTWDDAGNWQTDGPGRITIVQ